jgi:hypothetical protein
MIHSHGHVTSAQVQDELQLTLTINANNRLRNVSDLDRTRLCTYIYLQPLTIKGSSQLPDVVRQYARDLFRQNFGYDYTGTSTVPLDAISTTNLTAADGICSFTDGKQGHVSDFVKQMLKCVLFLPKSFFLIINIYNSSV